jgi:hypothetical protein
MSHTQDYLNELKKGCKYHETFFIECKEGTFCYYCSTRIEACEKLIEAIEKDIEQIKFNDDYAGDIIDYDKIKEILRGSQ